MQKLLLITFLALLPTIAWWILFYKKDPRKKRIREMMFVFLMGTMSIAPVYGYQIFSIKYLPHILELFPTIGNNQLLMNIISFGSIIGFILICILLIAILHSILKTFLHTFYSFFKMSFNLGPILIMVFFLLIIKIGISNIFEVDLLDNLIGIAMISAVLEEYIKHLIVPVVGDKKIKNINTAIMYSIDVGLAFAFVENILYLLSVPIENFWSTFFFRGMFTALGHVSFSAIFGYFYGRALFAEPILTEKEIKHQQFSALKTFRKIFRLKAVTTFQESQMVNGLLVATFVHTLYNLLLALNIFILPVILLIGCYFIIDYLLHLEETTRQYGLIGTKVISEKDFHDLRLKIDVLKALKDIRSQTSNALATVPVKQITPVIHLRKRLIGLMAVLILITASGLPLINWGGMHNYSANVFLVHHHLIEMAEDIEKEEYEHYIQKTNFETDYSTLEQSTTPETTETILDVFTENNRDTDGDGLKDFEEMYFKSDLNNPDSDGDGYSDYIEVSNGFNPNGLGKLNLSTDFKTILQELSHLSTP